jgi:hypothetical protein
MHKQTHLDFNMNPQINSFNINRMQGLNPIIFPVTINNNMNNINSRNRINDE